MEAKDHPTLRFLAGTDTTKTDDKTKDQAKPDAAGKPKPDAPAKGADGKDKPAAATPSPADATDELPADPKAANKRFAEMRTEVKALKETTKKLTEDAARLKEEADFGSEMAGVFTKPEVIEDFKLVNNEQLAGVVKIQGALNRTEHLLANGGQPTAQDRAVLEGAAQRLGAACAKAGIQFGSTAASIEPLKGDLPQKWADLVAIGEVTEDDARFYAGADALRAAKGKAPAAPATPPAAPAARPTAQPSQPPASRSAPASVDAMAADRELYRGMSRRLLVNDGIPDATITEHYKTNLLPAIISEYVAPNVPAGKNPVDVFLALSPAAQHDLVVKAQAAWKAKKAESARPAGREEGKPGQKPAQPIFRRTFGPRRGLPTHLQADTPENRQAAARNTLDFLAGKSDG